ncbi:MAG: 50S ribosomal protein L20 [Thermotogae bacterium]|nr:50S ribosomal protein L20 [Thermotogota bacterium]MCP5465956.1 50S ribosomal protein L20 [Thermotogota bacterium]HOO75623.1 50S ribosomal protein L20 [Tepiditoga sp.]
MRVKRAMTARKKKKMFLKAAKGYSGAIGRRYRLAKQQFYKSGVYAYTGRKDKKGDFRRLWITRISAAARAEGMRYNELIHGLKIANVNINRKMLSDLAISDYDSFKEYIDIAKKALEA